MATGSKSSRITPAEGLLRFISAMTLVLLFVWPFTTAPKKFRGLDAASAESRTSSKGNSFFAAFTSSRLYSMMACSVIVIVASIAKGNDETAVVEGFTIDFLTGLVSAFALFIGIWFVKSGRTNLPRRGYLDPAITPTMAILLCGAMFIFGGVGAYWGSSHGTEGTIDNTAWMYASGMLAQIPIVLVYAYLRKKCGSKHIAEISIITFVVFVPIAMATTGILHSVFSYVGIEPSTPIGHATLEQLTESPWTTATLVVIICVTVGAGIFEEVLYRGLMLPTFTALLGGKTAWGAIMVTSAIFASMHIGVSPPSALVGLFVLSIGLCWARVKSGGVLAPIIIHVVFNAMNIAFVYSTTL